MTAHTEALRKCVEVLKQVDFKDCAESPELWHQHGMALAEAERVLRDGVKQEPFAYFVQPSSFGPFIECESSQVGAFPAYRSSPTAVVALPGWQLVPNQPTPEMVNTLAEGNYSISITDAYVEMLKLAPQPAAAPSGDAWISVDERLPAAGELVLVLIPESENQQQDIRLDCIDPNYDDAASWYDHNEHYEHFCCVAKPPGTIGPSEKAPYTHWCAIPDVVPITATKE